jgi:phenylpropionate dioxygenase-like ring-hydroxylating dioxygenase large terminal subunit
MPSQVTGIAQGQTRFPRYDGAVNGFENYWYPVLRSRDVGAKPRALALFGHDILFVRENGRVHALEDRCPHRGVPLSLGRREFPGTLTCRYHGWTFDVNTGELVAALTDGPDSPICGKARVRTYPVEERAGLVWIYNGAGMPPPVDRDIPSEFLRPDAVIEGRITDRAGDFRYAAENGFDEGHAKYLHRNAWMMFFARMPGFARVNVAPDDERPWITRNVTDVFFQADYPGLGTWPKKRFWKKSRRGARLSIRMPGVLRSHHVGKWMHFEWYVPARADHHRYLQFVIARATGLKALSFRAYYWTFLRWLFHVQFNNQDARMVELMKTPPERLYRPDISLIAWRHLCENELAANERPDSATLAAPEILYADQESEQFRLAMERTTTATR